MPQFSRSCHARTYGLSLPPPFRGGVVCVTARTYSLLHACICFVCILVVVRLVVVCVSVWRACVHAVVREGVAVCGPPQISFRSSQMTCTYFLLLHCATLHRCHLITNERLPTIREVGSCHLRVGLLHRSASLLPSALRWSMELTPCRESRISMCMCCAHHVVSCFHNEPMLAHRYSCNC